MFHKSHKLELAARHVVRGLEIVDRQRALIARLKAEGCSTRQHEDLLALFVRSLAILQEHERELRSSKPWHDRGRTVIRPR